MGSDNVLITELVAALLLFGSVLLHELAHSPVAQTRGMTVTTTTLFILGGVGNLEGVMTDELHCKVAHEDDLNTALKLITKHDINQLLVIQDTRCAGLVSRADILSFSIVSFYINILIEYQA